VFRELGSQVLFLVVSSSDGLNWVLPKGHIDPGETPDTTALRELQEEAGVAGEIVAALSVQQFKKRDKDATVQYFLVQEVGSAEAIESRTLRWEDEKAALQLLTFEEARVALLEGAVIRRRRQQQEAG
jgi:8-oxo-dGTP pyrophosphatase MutT (NUDIX family)